MNTSDFLKKVEVQPNIDSKIEFINKHKNRMRSLKYLILLNEGILTWDGIDKNFETNILDTKNGEFGKPLEWYIQNNNAFRFLRVKEDNKQRFNPTKKAIVLQNICNNIPLEECKLLLKALSGKMFDAGEPMGGFGLKELSQIYPDKFEYIEPTNDENKTSEKPVKENTKQKPKKRGRPKKK